MRISELSEEEMRELAEIESHYDITICNPHLGLERISLRQLAEEMAEEEAKAARVQKPTPKVGARRKAA
jgi:dephospho-CoA kinase